MRGGIRLWFAGETAKSDLAHLTSGVPNRHSTSFESNTLLRIFRGFGQSVGATGSFGLAVRLHTVQVGEIVLRLLDGHFEVTKNKNSKQMSII